MKNKNKNDIYIGDAKVSELISRSGNFHRSGQYEEAEEIYRLLDTFGQAGPEELYLYGDCLIENRKFREAEIIFRRCLLLKKNWPEAACSLGNVFYEMERLDDAENIFRSALKKNPSSRLACNNLGNVLKDKGSDEEAIKFYRKALLIDPKFADGYYNLANALKECGKKAEAAELYSKCIELDPSNNSAVHLLSAISGARPAKAPDSYIEELFDEYSRSFDSELSSELEYSTPRNMAAALERLFPGKIFGNAADLGCGTGLSGAALKCFCGKIRGVDISAGMLEMAAGKKIYDSLSKSEISEFLEKEESVFDLLSAADSLIYCGEIREILKNAYNALAGGGIFIFSLESFSGREYELGESGRFRHSPVYIEKLAAGLSFRIIASDRVKLRKEFGEWVEGIIFVLEKSVLPSSD